MPALFLGQPVYAQDWSVTGVRLTEDRGRLQIVLEGQPQAEPAVFQSALESRLLIDILEAQLALPEAGPYRYENPSPGIELVTLEAVAPNGIRITVVGTGAVPTAEVETTEVGLALLVVPAGAPTAEPETATGLVLDPEDPLRIQVTGEAETVLPPYRVPNATTGTRTDTPLLDIPQSIQVVPEVVLREQGALSLGDALRNVSGVVPGDIAVGRPATAVIIRGFESENILRNGLRDDTLRFNASLTNIERVEFLKGPASVLFGSGNLGGTINLVTAEPLAEPFYEATFTAGSYGLYRSTADLTGPLNEAGRLAYRLNLAYQNADSFRDFESSDSFFFAPSFRVVDTETSSLIIDVEYLRDTSRGLAPELPASGTVLPNPFGQVDISTNLGEPSLARGTTTVGRVGYRLAHQLSPSWTVRNEFLASFQDTPESIGFTPVSLANDRLLTRVYTENPSDRRNYTLNTNLLGSFATGSVEHQLLMGLELSSEEAYDLINLRFLAPIDIFNPLYRPDSVFPPPTSGLTPLRLQDASTTIHSLGIYVQDQIRFSEQLIAVVGGRFDIAGQRFEDVANRFNPVVFDRQDTAFSPRLGVVYQPVNFLSLYASYSQSFDPQIGQTFTREVLQPERGQQFEVGAKANLLGDRLFVTLAYYHLQRSNFLQQDPVNPGFQIQIGNQRSQGVELDLVGEILPGWNLIASYAYTDAIITEDRRADLVGNRLQNVPQHAASLWTTYTLQEGAWQGLGGGIGVFFAGDRQGDLENTFTLPSYVRTDAAVFYRRGAFSAQINLQNLFNLRYFESARSDVRVNPGAPFTVLGTVGWEF